MSTAPVSKGGEGHPRRKTDPGLVLIVGAPRSGTTWVQLLLAQHPKIVSAVETYLFSRYAAALWQKWRFDAQHREVAGVGLTNLVTEEQFDRSVRRFATDIFENILQRRPDAEMILEKTPNNVLHAELILRLFPQTKFIHLIRDPRAVSASMLHAAATWGQHWAPRTALQAALAWEKSVTAGMRLREKTSQYLELRYESLVADTPGELRRMFAWLGLDTDRRCVEEYVGACALDRLRAGARDEQTYLIPVDTARRGEFFRGGGADSWRGELTRRQMRAIEHVAWDLMRTLGYDAVFENKPQAPMTLGIRKALEGMSWRVGALYERMHRRL